MRGRALELLNTATLIVLLLCSGSYCVTRAGSSIESQAEIQYDNGNITTSESLSVVVDQMFGITIEPTGAGAQTYVGSTYYFHHMLYNLGNCSNSVIFYFNRSTLETWSYSLIKDDNMNCTHESGENTPLDDPLPISEDAQICFFVAVTVPSAETANATRNVNCVATGEVNDGGFYMGANGLIYGGPDSAEVNDILTAESGRPTTLEIERVPGTSNIKLKWQGGMTVDVYTLTPSGGSYYDYNGSWTKEATSSSPTEWTDAAAGSVNQKYYRVAAAGTSMYALDENGRYEAVGKYNIGLSMDDPNKFFISFPLLMRNNGITNEIGDQASNGDVLVYFNSEGVATLMVNYDPALGGWIDPYTEMATTSKIEAGKGYAYQSATDKDIAALGMVGSIDNVLTIEGNNGSGSVGYFIGSAYPVEYTMPISGLNVSSLGDESYNSGNIYLFDKNGQVVGAAIHTSDDPWSDMWGSPSGMGMKPGKGYVFMEPIKPSIAWKQPKP